MWHRSRGHLTLTFIQETAALALLHEHSTKGREMRAASIDGHPTIAIVGSGPSGCYSAQFLRKVWPASEICIFDALPAPYGLVRYGVAADHQGAKAVTRQFDRLFQRDAVRFLGNVRIGTDVAFSDLADAFDVVVLATGLWHDRPLGVPQDRGARVLGAGTLLRGVNGYPGLATSPELSHPVGRRVVIVGNGNVAMDALRLLVKQRSDLEGSDVDDDLLNVLRGVPIEQIDIVGRSTASSAKFDTAVLRELLHLSNVDIEIGETAGDDQNPVLDLLRTVSVDKERAATAADRVTVRFHFGQTPTAVTVVDDKTVLKTQGTNDPRRTRAYAADTIVTAAGFVAGEDSAPTAWDATNVWRAGWLSSGARGTIPENRRAAAQLSDSIAAAVHDHTVSTGKPGVAAIWPQIAEFVVEFDGWRKVDEHERHHAPDGRCRRKITDVNQMVAVATGEHAALLMA